MTNGYNDTAVSALEARLAWLQPTTSGYDIVSDANQISLSGRYFNDDSFHVATTIENIKDCQNDPNMDDDQFNAYLVRLRKSNVLSMLNQVFDQPQIIDSGLAFRKHEATQRTPISNSGKFVGLRIKIARGTGITLKNVLLLLDSDKTFPIYLFNSLSNGTETVANVTLDVPYIKKWDATVKANSETSVTLNYDIEDNGGVWFLGYFQSDLGTAKAISYNPCYNCYYAVNLISFESAVTGSDINREVYGMSKSMYGLNLDFTTYKDISDNIESSAHLFDNLQGLMMSVKVFELIQNSVRSNRLQRISMEMLSAYIVQIEGLKTDTGQWIPGVRSAITREIKKIKDAFYGQTKSITATNVIPNDLY